MRCRFSQAHDIVAHATSPAGDLLALLRGGPQIACGRTSGDRPISGEAVRADGRGATGSPGESDGVEVNTRFIAFAAASESGCCGRARRVWRSQDELLVHVWNGCKTGTVRRPAPALGLDMSQLHNHISSAGPSGESSWGTCALLRSPKRYGRS